MRAFLRRWRWALLTALLILAGLAYAFWPQPVVVDVAAVTEGPMLVGVTDDGITRVHDVYVVSAPVTGQIARIELEPGDDVVARKTVIAQMSPRPSVLLDERTRRELTSALSAAEAAERLARAEVSRSSASAGLARRERSRAEQLARDGFVTRARLDAARTAVREAEAALDMAEAALRQRQSETLRVRASLAEPTASDGKAGSLVAVRSPASGKLLRILQKSEAIVPEGTPLVEVGDPANIEVVIDLLSREAVKVAPGARVIVTRWGGGDDLHGAVRLVEPFGTLKVSALGIEEQRVNVIIDLKEPTDRIARLGHGYQVDATIVLWERAKVLRVPIGALFRSGGRWHVFAVEADRASLTPIEIGHINDEHAEVVKGLAAGTRVIVNPGEAVAGGVRIRQRRSTGGAG